jgi:hypothetical protein
LSRSLPSVLLFAALAVTSTASAADSVRRGSLLQNPAQTKQTIAAAASCKWQKEGMSQTCRGEAFIKLHYAPNGDLEDVEFMVLRAVITGDGPRKTPKAKKGEAALLNTIAALFPSWPDSRSWMAAAFEKSVERYFHNSIRIDGTSIYVREHLYVDRDEPYAYVVLTEKKDLTEYKFMPCDDDEQGPLDDRHCPPRPRGEERPPDNPVLHPQ